MVAKFVPFFLLQVDVSVWLEVSLQNSRPQNSFQTLLLKSFPRPFRNSHFNSKWKRTKVTMCTRSSSLSLISVSYQLYHLQISLSNSTAANFYCEPQIIIFKIHYKLEISLHKPFWRKHEAFGEKIEIIDNHVDNATQIFTIMKVSNICWVFIQKDFERCILLN